MNKLITLALILLTINGSIAKDDGDDQIMESSCLGKFTGVFHSFIYFARNASSTDYTVIRTSWLITYPDRVKHELIAHNFTVFDKNPADNCDWVLRSKIQKATIYTGYVYQKNDEDRVTLAAAGKILSHLYPSAEIAMCVLLPIPFILIMLFIWKMYID